MSAIKNWNNVKQELKKKFNKLSSELLDDREGNADNIIVELQRTYNVSKAEAKEKLNDIVSQVEDNVQYVPDYIRKAGHNIEEFSNVAADKVDGFMESCGKAGSNAKAELESGVSHVLDYVNKHPVKSLLAAAAVGLLFSKFISK